MLSKMDTASVIRITREDLQGAEDSRPASISDVKHLSSYNWIEAPHDEPCIVVPGCPALWRVPRTQEALQKDSGFDFIAQNAYRHPESPLEPLFRALYITEPSFDLRSVDVVTDRDNLRKLLSFADPSLRNGRYDLFTINVEVTKNTAIFCRQAKATNNANGPNEFLGYHDSFKEAYTIDQIKGSTGHHRIITYKFGGLKFIVRHESDGYVGMTSAVSVNSLASQKDIVAAAAVETSKLHVKQQGTRVPLEATLVIKTRAYRKNIPFDEVAPRLWASQTPKLVRAYHVKGQFRNPAVEDVSVSVKLWETVHQEELKRLAMLIKKIIAAVKECGGKAVVNLGESQNELLIRKSDGKKMLPDHLYCKWNDEESSNEETTADEPFKMIKKEEWSKDEGTGMPHIVPAFDDTETRASTVGNIPQV